MATTETINGFACKDCTDIDYAKKHIDPAHPKNGPYDINKPKDEDDKALKATGDPAVLYAGAVTGPAALDATGLARREAQKPVRIEGGHVDGRV
jgi:hypothetical protein